MATTQSQIRNFYLSPTELKALTGWPDVVIEFLLNLADGVVITSQEIDATTVSSEINLLPNIPLCPGEDVSPTLQPGTDKLELLLLSPLASMPVHDGDLSPQQIVFSQEGNLLPPSTNDHGVLSGLGDDDHAQYLLLNGRTGGQVAYGGTGASENLDLNSTSHATKGNIRIYDIPVLSKVSGNGIKVDLSTPTYGFRDLLGEIKILSPGANDPTLAVFRDSVRAFSFSNAVMNEVNFHFHIPHDYVPGSDIFLHFHWSQNVVDSGGLAGIPGEVKWQAEVTYAKGHDQAAFPASFTTSITDTASGTQYQHMLVEVQLSATSPSATQIDSDILEPDGLIILRAFRDPADAADTLNQVPFLHYIDIHYQSTNIATKAKAPDFYS
jgi:hypothetical protein